MPSTALLRHHMTQALRLALPLGALVLMSTIFLASRSVDPSRAVELADFDITEMTREPRIGSARFAGMTHDDAAFTVSADTVRSPTTPQQGDPINLFLDQPQGEIAFRGGRSVQFTAQHGQIDEFANLLTMSDDIFLLSSEGYDLSMPQLRAELDTARIEGRGGVFGNGPGGEIRADQLVITPLQDTKDGYLLDFSGDVRLLYRPDH